MPTCLKSTPASLYLSATGDESFLTSDSSWPGVYFASLYGPDPTGFVFSFGMLFGAYTAPSRYESAHSTSPGWGAFGSRCSTSVVGFTTSIFLMTVSDVRYGLLAVCSMLVFTAAASSGSPSENVRFGWRWNVICVGLSTVQLDATPGSIVVFDGLVTLWSMSASSWYEQPLNNEPGSMLSPNALVRSTP